ncbi:MAG: hypothetical protein U5L96_08065 [Owenweeksia sp.]|nr:hypothetical protein [Owenweeksia sp.]
MIKRLHTALLLLLALSLYASDPIDRDDLIVSVRAPKSVIPGQFETFILELSNDYDFPLNFDVSVDKPSSWRFLSPVNKVQLQPGEKKTVIFLMDIDRACEIGPKNIRFEFYDKQRDVKIVENVVTTVENIHRLEARAVRHPNHLMSGQSYEVEFVVRNLGNCYEEVQITSENGTPDLEEITMPPNSTYHIKVKQTAPTVKHIGYIPSDISLITDSAQVPLRKRISLKIYPKVTERTDPYHRFPIEMSLIYFGARTAQPYSGGLQVELEGEGFIDRKDNHKLYFKARGPNRFSVARVGNFDQYTLEYTWQQNRHNSTHIRLGDFAFNLTPVTEMYRWARGVGVTQTFKKIEVGAFYNQPRFIDEIEQQFAAYGKYSVRKNWDIQLSAMNKQFKGGRSGQLMSFQNTVSFLNQKLIAEYAFGGSGGNTGTAASLEMVGSLKKWGLSYSTQNIYASQFFPGYYSNSLFSNTSLRYRRKKLMLSANYSYNDANPAQDTIFSAAPYSTNATVGATYYFTSDLRTTVSLIKRSKEDRFPTKKFSYRENAVRYMTTYNSDFWKMRLDGELGQTQNLLVNSDNISNTFNVRARAERQVFKWWSLGGFGQYLYNNRYTRSLQQYLLYGVNTTIRPTRNVSLMASYRNNYLIEEYNSDRSLVDVRLRGRFEDHEFSLGVSHALIRNTVDRKDFFVNARYTYRLNTPIRKKEGLYTLTGKISADNPRDAQGIVLHLAGQSVMTDDYGRFIFNDLPVGLHYLHLDMGTLDIGLVTSVETPVEVEIMPKERNYISIDLLRSGSITGKIDFKGNPRVNDQGEEGYPLEVIKATSGDRELLTYTDDKGHYSFKQVLPGEWKVRVVETTTNNGSWVLANNNQSVNVAAGRKKEINFEMKKKQRKIKFKSQQTLDLKIKKD